MDKSRSNPAGCEKFEGEAIICDECGTMNNAHHSASCVDKHEKKQGCGCLYGDGNHGKIRCRKGQLCPECNNHSPYEGASLAVKREIKANSPTFEDTEPEDEDTGAFKHGDSESGSFILSDKIGNCSSTDLEDGNVLNPKDVKEFIRRLKEDLEDTHNSSWVFQSFLIDKLAGSKLI